MSNGITGEGHEEQYPAGEWHNADSKGSYMRAMVIDMYDYAKER